MTDLVPPAPPPAAQDPKPSALVSGVAIAQTTNPVSPPQTSLPPHVKQTFLEKAKIDAEDAYHWLVAEIHKIYKAL